MMFQKPVIRKKPENNYYLCAMAEELTTKMHYEFVEGEISKRDFDIMSVYGAISRGVPKQEALDEHGMSAEEYDANIERVLSQS